MRKPRKPLKLWEKKARELEKHPSGQVPLSDDLQTNCKIIDDIVQDCEDVFYRDFSIPTSPPLAARLYALRGMVDLDLINESIIAPLTAANKVQTFSSVTEVISTHNIFEATDIDKAVNYIFRGEALLLIQGSSMAWGINTRAAQLRSISEPQTQTAIRGPRDGFIEDVETNVALLRQRIKSPRLKFTTHQVGKLTQTPVAIAHIEGLADPLIIKELESRLDKIDIDGILESGQLEQLIEDNTLSPFPQISNSERPDAVAAALLDGRVAILTENTPFVLVIPTVLTDMLQSNEDYYHRFHFATAIRFLRYVMFALALLGPALYIAITTFHHELIPTTLLISLIAARSGVPFPAIIEALLMELAFEALREAGIRLPRPAGQAVSIVGALVIGQAAVQAGLVSSIMVIVVAGTGIASFTIPAFNAAISIRLLRFPFMLLATTLGLHGVNLGLSVLLIHMVSLRSFGVPYLAPLAPLTMADWKDLLLRGPIWWMYLRPTFIVKENVERQAPTSRSFQPEVKEKSE